MPDVHYGKGATVGSVIAMRDAVSPAAVGVDIGCGMTAVKSSLTVEDLPDDLSRLRAQIEKAVPVGRGAHKNPVDPAGVPGLKERGWHEFWSGFDDLTPAVRGRRPGARPDGHAGLGQPLPRGVRGRRGRDLDRAALRARATSARSSRTTTSRPRRRLPHNQDLPDRDLAVFVAGTRKMEEYRRDLYWAQDYARRNRAVMMALVQNVSRALRRRRVALGRADLLPPQLRGGGGLRRRRAARHPQGRDPGGRGRPRHHPGLDGDRHVHRARPRQREAFNSASHGAGRRMSRRQAKQAVHASRTSSRRRRASSAARTPA